MRKLSRKQMVVGGALVLLIVANLVLYWPGRKHEGTGELRDRPPGEGGSPEMKANFQAALQKLPEGEREVVVKRMEADRIFFDSVKELPEKERDAKIAEHFAQNPPPQISGMALPPGDGGPHDGLGGGPGGPGGGPPDGGPEHGHIPPPEMRRSMDQRVVDSQKGAS